jgi:hypothetical protein
MNRRGIIDGLRKVDRHLSRRISNSRKVLIDAKTPMNFSVIAPVFKALHCDARIDFYFTSSSQSKGADYVFEELKSSEKIIGPRHAAIMRFDAYITADLMWAKLPRGAQRVYMFHGVAGKYADVYDRPDFSMRQWDRIFFINRRRLRNFIAAGAIDPDATAARLIGYPKLDCLVDGSLRRDEVIHSLGMDSNGPVILYAPTWSPYSSLNSVGVELVEQLCIAGYKVIVKLHDRSWHPDYEYSGGVNWAEQLEPLLVRNGGILARGSDATPFLAAADVMITDHSSAGFEYLLLDRPLIRIEMPELIAATRIPSEYVSLLADASLTVRTAAEAVRAVGRCLTDPAAQSMSRKSVAEELFFDPGTATSRAVDDLYQVLELDPFVGKNTVAGSVS